MFLRHLDLTTALRPSLYDDETLLFVQNGIGLYEGKFKIPNYQNGHAYLTSHRVCYVDNEDPRKYSVAVALKEIERPEFSARFLKSSPKVTLFPKAMKRGVQAIRSPIPRYASPADALITPGASTPRSIAQSPAPAPARDIKATWICPICGMSSAVPKNFDPATTNQHTPLPPCQTCGVKPPLSLLIKVAIASMSNRAPAPSSAHNGLGSSINGGSDDPSTAQRDINQCPRCTFQNDPSMRECEICGAPLSAAGVVAARSVADEQLRPESPGPTLGTTILDDDTIETIKFSFRAGGEKTFLDRLKGALVQRKWLLQSAPPIPKPGGTPTRTSFDTSSFSDGQPRASTPQQRVVGIAGLERRGAELRQNNQTVIGTAFEDLEALMTSAKEVIAMAEQFAKQNDNDSVEARDILSDSASALGLVTTKDMLGAGSSSETLYITELSRNLAEFLTDDRRGVLRREGGIMSLVDLWAVFNRTRNGIELISPLDFEKAAEMWDGLRLPIRLRTFKSGLRVVQERNRTDEKTIAALLAWLRDPNNGFGEGINTYAEAFGLGVTAQQTAERFGWSVGVATEELEMAEEMGALARDPSLDGIRFWENHFSSTFSEAPGKRMDAVTMLNELRV